MEWLFTFGRDASIARSVRGPTVCLNREIVGCDAKRPALRSDWNAVVRWSQSSAEPSANAAERRRLAALLEMVGCELHQNRNIC
jgi:hypothetical protein